MVIILHFKDAKIYSIIDCVLEEFLPSLDLNITTIANYFFENLSKAYFHSFFPYNIPRLIS